MDIVLLLIALDDDAMSPDKALTTNIHCSNLNFWQSLDLVLLNIVAKAS